MRVETTAGTYTVTKAPWKGLGSPVRLQVDTDTTEAMQALVDGIETLCGVPAQPMGTTVYGPSIILDPEHLAQWLAFEVREYINYENFPEN